MKNDKVLGTKRVFRFARWIKRLTTPKKKSVITEDNLIEVFDVLVKSDIRL